jgi:hypothetical protein
MRPIVLGVSALLLTNAAMAQEVTLKAVTAFTENTTYARPFERFINRVNEDGKGILRINYVGGPKAMPPFEVGNALKGGVIDLANATGAFYTNAMPEADAWKLTERPMSELRQNGGYAAMATIYAQKLNAVFLARLVDNNPFHLYVNKPISAPDLTGLKLRITPVIAFFRPWAGPSCRLHRAGVPGARARRRRRLRLADHRHLRPRMEREDEIPGRPRLLQCGSLGAHQQEFVGPAERGAAECSAQIGRARRS